MSVVISGPFIGQIVLFAGNFAPQGWALCDGQILPIAQNQALFSVIRPTYGGDGKTTFALPDLRGRVPVHPGQGPGLPNYDLGEQGGEPTHTLSQSEMPTHTHAAGAKGAGGDSSTPGTDEVWAGSTVLDYIYSSEAQDTTLSGAAIGKTGGSQPHNNMQPYLGVNFIIAIQAVYPSA